MYQREKIDQARWYLIRCSVPASILGAVLLVAQVALSFALPAQDASNPWWEIDDQLLFVVYNLLLGIALLLFAVSLVGLHARRAEYSGWPGRMDLFLALGAGALVVVSIVATLMVSLWPGLFVLLITFTQLLAVFCLVVGLVLWGIHTVQADSSSLEWMSSVRWREVLLILVAGSGAALVTHGVEWVVVNGEFWDLSGAHWLHVLLTIPVAAWVARKIGASPVLYGVVVGVFSGIANQVYFHTLLYSVQAGDKPLAWDEVTTILIGCIVAGLLGGILAQIWPVPPEQEALYQTSRAISMASSPQGIVDAIGEHFADIQVSHVALWKDVFSEAGDGVEVALQAVWIPHAARIWGHGGWQPGLRLDTTQVPALASLGQQPVLRVRELPASERAVWESQNIHSVLLLPLVAPNGARVGLLMVASRRTYGFSKGMVRAYLNIGAQVALALEDVKLRAARRNQNLEAASGRRGREQAE